VSPISNPSSCSASLQNLPDQLRSNVELTGQILNDARESVPELADETFMAIAGSGMQTLARLNQQLVNEHNTRCPADPYTPVKMIEWGEPSQAKQPAQPCPPASMGGCTFIDTPKIKLPLPPEQPAQPYGPPPPLDDFIKLPLINIRPN
jgi:hypothetical protein